MTIDTDRSEATDLLFNCKQCERTLSARELVDIGLNPEKDRGTKRFKELEIDRTAAGIIKTLPKFSDETMTILEGK